MSQIIPTTMHVEANNVAYMGHVARRTAAAVERRVWDCAAIPKEGKAVVLMITLLYRERSVWKMSGEPLAVNSTPLESKQTFSHRHCSKTNVTGPSLIRATCMSAPNWPVATATPAACTATMNAS